MGKHIERVFKEKFAEAKPSLFQQGQLVNDTDGFLGHSCNWGSQYYKAHALQNAIPGCCFWFPSYV